MPRPSLPWQGSPGKRLRYRLGFAAAGVVVIAACLTIRHYWGDERVGAEPVPSQATAPARRPAPAAGNLVQRISQLRVIARVNGEEITPNQLAEECLKHYGTDVLETYSNKFLILEACKASGISVTDKEIDAEIERLAKRFEAPVDQWLRMMLEQDGINEYQYRNDLTWPTLALRKLANESIQVTPEEIQKEYEARYGPSVRVRLIVCDRADRAEALRAEALADPSRFGELAKNYSVDASSASVMGLIQPIHMHMGDERIEQVAFALKVGEISPVIQLAGDVNQWVILKCERRLEGRPHSLEQVAGWLEDLVRQAKLRMVAGGLLQSLQEKARIENILNDPVKRRQMPGVAATINGRILSVQYLAELCLDRHGEKVLEGTINRLLLEQACRKAKVVVTEEDMNAEIARAASSRVLPKEDGAPDVEAWIELYTKQNGVSAEVYRTDAVWPSVALRKLVGHTVEVTEEDIQRGFEANYGPRVRCLAIVLNSHRRAQDVWQKARANPTVEYFGDLATEYSVEPDSRALRGEVRPIQKYGGQPLLEQDAFALKPGELSQIIVVGREQYVILMCLEQTKPVEVEVAEVRDIIHEEIFEKKLYGAMARHFDKLRASATIDNFVTGTTQSPQQATASRAGSSATTVQ